MIIENTCYSLGSFLEFAVISSVKDDKYSSSDFFLDCLRIFIGSIEIIEKPRKDSSKIYTLFLEVSNEYFTCMIIVIMLSISWS